jgi:ectoine hydroxylase-related dioxygenase (phytanoyl-CoA dioxygenase family)
MLISMLRMTNLYDHFILTIRAYNHAGAVNHQTFLMAVNDMDMNNGCLEVVPGSHKQQVPLGANKVRSSTNIC